MSIDCPLPLRLGLRTLTVDTSRVVLRCAAWNFSTFRRRCSGSRRFGRFRQMRMYVCRSLYEVRQLPFPVQLSIRVQSRTLFINSRSMPPGKKRSASAGLLPSGPQKPTHKRLSACATDASGAEGAQLSRRSSVRRASSAALKLAVSAGGARRRRTTRTIATIPMSKAAGGSPHKAAVCHANCGRSSTNSP